MLFRNNKLVATNNQVLRSAGDNSGCPSAGFREIVVKGRYFTITQQICIGHLLIKEYITFRYNPADSAKETLLYKFGRTFTDYRDPGKKIPDNVVTGKVFGIIRFQDLHLDAFYKKFLQE